MVLLWSPNHGWLGLRCIGPWGMVKPRSHIHSGARTASKNRNFGQFRTVPSRLPHGSHGHRDICHQPYGRRGAELAAFDSPGLFIWPLGRRKPIEGPWWHPRGPVRAPAGGRAGSARFFCQFSWKTLTGALRCSRVPHGYPSAPSRAPHGPPQRSRAICTTPGACRPGSVWCKNCPCGPLMAASNPRELV